MPISRSLPFSSLRSRLTRKTAGSSGSDSSSASSRSENSESSATSDASSDPSSFHERKDKNSFESSSRDFQTAAPKPKTESASTPKLGLPLIGGQPDKLAGAVGLRRSNATRLGVAGKKTPFAQKEATAPVARGRSLERTHNYKVEVLEFGQTKIHMIKTEERGSYGEYYRGIDQNGTMVGIKELRSLYEVKELQAKGQRATTHPTIGIRARAEVNLAKLFCPELEVRDLVIGRDKKPYLIMRPMEGGADELMFYTPHADRPLMGRTIFMALAAHASRIHEKGGFHCDLKTANGLWDSTGLICIADCGLSSKKATSTKARGTYLSTEMVEAREPFGHKADSWSLGVSIAAAFNDGHGDEGFLGKNLPDIRNNLINFSAWRSAKMGGVVPEKYIKNNPYDAFFAPLLKQDPALAHYLITRVLDPDSQARPSCAQIVKDLGAIGHTEAEHQRGLQALLTQEPDPAKETEKAFLQSLVERS